MTFEDARKDVREESRFDAMLTRRQRIIINIEEICKVLFFKTAATEKIKALFAKSEQKRRKTVKKTYFFDSGTRFTSRLSIIIFFTL